MSSPAVRRARPVAGLPLEPLLARSREAARRWAIALIVTRPLDALGAIPLEALAAAAPGLIEQVTLALGSDDALGDLLAGAAGGTAEAGAPGLADFAGSPHPAALAEAAEALRGVLWELLLEVLPRGPEPGTARLLGDLSDRLAQTCAELLAAALRHGADGVEGADTPLRDQVPVPPAAPARTGRSAVDPPAAAGEAEEEQGIVIVDERRAAYAPIERPPFRERVAATDTVGAAELRRRAMLAAAAPAGAEIAGDAEISVRDERAGEPVAGERPGGERAGEQVAGERPGGERAGEQVAGERPGGEIASERAASGQGTGVRPGEPGGEGPAAWVGSIGRELRRHESDGQPFAVLLVQAPTGQDGSGEPLQRELEDALAAELREIGGSLTRERAGRWWALAPRTDRLGAQALAVRLGQVVEAIGRRTGAGGTVSIGTAVCPDDGTQAAALAAHADVSLYASRAEARAGGWQPAGPA